jgi:predicted transcriptional regulator
MENQRSDLNTDTDGVSEGESNNSFFSEEAITHLIARLNQRQYKDNIERNNLLLDLIRAKQPISKYELAKVSGISYTTIKRILRELEFCELVAVTLSLDGNKSENGMPVQLVSIPKSNTGEKK